MDDLMQICITNCNNSRDASLKTIEYYRAKEGENISPEFIQLLEDCAKMCETSVDFMERESENHAEVCGLCADICEQAVEACRQFGDDTELQECAETIEKSAKSCREMSRAS